MYMYLASSKYFKRNLKHNLFGIRKKPQLKNYQQCGPMKAT